MRFTSAGQPHVVPTGFRVSDDQEAIEISGHALAARRPLYLRHIETNPFASKRSLDRADTSTLEQP